MSDTSAVLHGYTVLHKEKLKTYYNCMSKKKQRQMSQNNLSTIL